MDGLRRCSRDWSHNSDVKITVRWNGNTLPHAKRHCKTYTCTHLTLWHGITLYWPCWFINCDLALTNAICHVVVNCCDRTPFFCSDLALRVFPAETRSTVYCWLHIIPKQVWSGKKMTCGLNVLVILLVDFAQPLILEFLPRGQSTCALYRHENE